MAGVGIPAKCGANAAKFVCGNCGSHPTATNQNANLCGLGLYGLPNLFYVVWIVVRNGAVVSTEVNQLMSASAQLFNHSFVQWVATMICANCDSHTNHLRSRRSSLSFSNSELICFL